MTGEILSAPRPEVESFARLMEQKLREHDDRPGWRGNDPSALLLRLREEVDELAEALFDGERRWIASEAADVGNFAMMIADVVGGLAWAEQTIAAGHGVIDAEG